MKGGTRMLGGVLLGIAALLSACGEHGGTRSTNGRSVAWQKDLAQALAAAGREEKLVMVDFYTDWCGWCRKLDETTFADRAVLRKLEGLVNVKLNAERDGRAAASRYRVDGYPTVLFLNAGGEEVGRIPGYLPPRAFLEELEDILDKHTSVR